MIIAAISQGSLSSAPPESAIAAAANSVSNLLFGPLATAIAIIAIASIGLALMTGRIELRRALSILIGCFLLFGARGLADGIHSAAIKRTQSNLATTPPSPVFLKPLPSASSTNAFDPYAGAAIQSDR